MYVEDVEDRSNTPKGCNAMYVKDVEDISNTPKGYNAMYAGDVEDVKDRSKEKYFPTNSNHSNQANLTLNLKLYLSDISFIKGTES